MKWVFMLFGDGGPWTHLSSLDVEINVFSAQMNESRASVIQRGKSIYEYLIDIS